MNFWDKITGADMTREMALFEGRAQALPADLRAAWEEIRLQLWHHADLTGRNLMPLFNGALGLLEEAAADGQSAQEVLGGDIEGFCTALAGEEGAHTARDKWRRQLSRNVAKKFGR